MGSPRILAVGTAVPRTSFTQDELINLFGYTDPPRRKLFRHSGIERRHFFVDAALARPDENVDQLAARFEARSVALGAEAGRACLDPGSPRLSGIDFLAPTTSHTALGPTP